MTKKQTTSDKLDVINKKIRECKDPDRKKTLKEERDEILRLFLAQVNNRQDEGRPW